MSIRRGKAASSPTAPGSESDLAAALDALSALTGALRAGSRIVEQRLGISGAQLFVLQKLAEGPVASLNELAERTFTHQSSVSVVVTRLVARGLVTRTVFPDDARRVTIALTPRGRALLRKAPEPLQARLLASLKRRSRSERKALARGLEQLVGEAGIAGGTPTTFFGDEALRPRLARSDRRRPADGRGTSSAVGR
jgi:DNA-binding MarR family transcriptional regulator